MSEIQEPEIYPNAPAIILVNPQMGENIGAAARVMHNFGLTDLRIVNPRDGWPNLAAEAMSAKAIGLIQAAPIYTTTAEAVADMQVVYATSARMRDMAKPVVESPFLGEKLHQYARAGVRTAILFGAERSGLLNEDVVLADALLTIPVNPENPSLNLAQAVAVVAYEWARGGHVLRAEESALSSMHSGEVEDSVPPPESASALSDSPARGELFTEPSARAVSLENQEDFSGDNQTKQLDREQSNKARLYAMLEHLVEALEAKGHFHPPGKRAVMEANIRNMFTRAGLTEQEVQSMRGIIRSLGGEFQNKPRH